MSDAPRALSVTEAMTLAKRTLEGLPVRVLGEVSEFTDRSGYKAVYFTLTDGSSTMSCLIWRDAFEASGVTMRDGLLVEVSGSLTVYAPKGRMQFQVRRLEAAGEGVLRMQVAALARRLEAEGLMRADRKRVLPEFPERIALVTSPRGKAVHDVIRTLRRRYPSGELLIAGVAVEGVGAAASIVEGMRAAGASGADVVILARGGGSYEDLMPFSDEAVVRAVVACPVPVVTGIGHEPDTSLADMVADLRASTPTAAAEAVAPACDEVAARLASMQRLLGRALQHTVRRDSHRLAVARSHAVFRDAAALTALPAQRVDIAAAGLLRALPGALARDRARVTVAGQRLSPAERRILDGSTVAFRHAAERLEDLSPLGILARGYAVCYAADGSAVVRSARQLSPGDEVTVRLHEGSAGCIVSTVNEEKAGQS
ncbi:MAG TPA: exodeoxyribonuclease VII large subunit [Coriobacteriia bacterium]